MSGKIWDSEAVTCQCLDSVLTVGNRVVGEGAAAESGPRSDAEEYPDKRGSLCPRGQSPFGVRNVQSAPCMKCDSIGCRGRLGVEDDLLDFGQGGGMMRLQMNLDRRRGDDIAVAGSIWASFQRLAVLGTQAHCSGKKFV